MHTSRQFFFLNVTTVYSNSALDSKFVVIFVVRSNEIKKYFNFFFIQKCQPSKHYYMHLKRKCSKQIQAYMHFCSLNGDLKIPLYLLGLNKLFCKYFMPDDQGKKGVKRRKVMKNVRIYTDDEIADIIDDFLKHTDYNHDGFLTYGEFKLMDFKEILKAAKKPGKSFIL